MGEAFDAGGIHMALSLTPALSRWANPSRDIGFAHIGIRFPLAQRERAG